MALFETIADRRIAAAREAGLFDNLPGAGKPIADLHLERPPGWWASRVVKSERARLRVEELRDEIERAMPGIWRLPDAEAVREQLDTLNRKISDHNVVAPDLPVMPLQPDEVVARWRQLRADLD